MSGNKLGILGAGESGVGAAILGKEQGYDVWVTDSGEIKEKYKKELREAGILFEENGHDVERLLGVDLVIKSPGIPSGVKVVELCRAKGLEVCSEIDFAARYTKAVLIGVTGSNGKTTTCMLIHQILHNAGLNVVLAGNIGNSFAREVARSKAEYYVLELSSFQLEQIGKTRLNVAVVLNITPDHLDRYDGEIVKYGQAKMQIVKNQLMEDHVVLNADDELIEQLLPEELRSERHFFSLKDEQENGAYIKEKEIIVNTKKSNLVMRIKQLGLQGKHNVQNSMAASIASRVLEIKKDVIRESLTDFQHVEHRLEFVAKVQGIEFVNDSKATNVNATWYALESTGGPIVWIAGGVDKGNDYDMLREIVKDKVDVLICLGRDNEKIKAAFGDVVNNVYEVTSASEAVQIAYNSAEKDTRVLLSPACASFDLFESFEDRGEQFKKAVRSL